MPCVWTYWHDEKRGLSEMRRDYLNTWDRHLGPEWDIHVLTDAILSKYVNVELTQYKKCGFAAFSDVLRLYLLGRYGGLWLDASIVLQKPIHSIIDDPHRVTVFRLKSRNYVESWFLYTPKKYRHIFKLWYSELRSVMDQWPHVCHHRAYQSVPIQVNKPIHYYMVYQSWCYLVQNNPRFKQTFAEARVLPVCWEMFVLGNKQLGAYLLKTTHKTRWMYKHRCRIYSVVCIVFFFFLCCLIPNKKKTRERVKKKM